MSRSGTAPPPSSDGVRRTLLANRRRDTSIELAVRRLLHAAGARYRVDFAPDPTNRGRRADIVFARAKVAVFMDGCFWHGCPEHFVPPRSNTEYWGPKIARNMERDRETTERLEALGWTVMRFWEHEDPLEAAGTILEVLHRSRSSRSSVGGRP